MTFKFTAKYIPEPDLIFGNRNEDKDPRIGLSNYGPYFHEGENTPLESVSVGIIGNKECACLARQVLKIIESPASTSKPNKWLFTDYPGMNKGSKFRCAIKTSDNWNDSLSDDFELTPMAKIEDANERIGQAVELYLKKIGNIAGRDDPPDVVVCTIPHTVELHCGIGKNTYGAKTTRTTPLERRKAELESEHQRFILQWLEVPDENDNAAKKAFDFRNSIKGKAMRHGIPIQLVRESTLKRICTCGEPDDKGQDLATFSWNFSTALYYKAKGKPWRLAKLSQDTCYVGVTFFVNKLSRTREVQISMAQVFTHNGEGLVLRGTEVDLDTKTKRPYLKRAQAEDLMDRALSKYRDHAGRMPATVVVHKSSEFSEDEQAGFNNAISNIGIQKKDFVAIRHSHGWINFIRSGKYPVLRGTMVEISPSEFMLYSSGFSPRIRTYAGHRIPHPLHIIHVGDSQNEHVAKEILGLTKLNWNTTAFSTALPITIKFANEVGKILSELPENEAVESHYRFFM